MATRIKDSRTSTVMKTGYKIRILFINKYGNKKGSYQAVQMSEKTGWDKPTMQKIKSRGCEARLRKDRMLMKMEKQCRKKISSKTINDRRTNGCHGKNSTKKAIPERQN